MSLKHFYTKHWIEGAASITSVLYRDGVKA